MTRRLWLQFGAVSALSGSPYLFIRLALDGGLDPVVIAFTRVGIGALTVLPFAVATRALRDVRRHWRPLLVVALLNIVLPFVLIPLGQQSVSSSLAGILIASTPLFVALFAAGGADPTERVSGTALAGLLLGFTGVAVLLGFNHGSTAASLAGAVSVLLAGLGYAAAALVIKRYLRAVSPLGIATVTMGISTLLLAAPAAVHGFPAHPSVGLLSTLLALGIVFTGVLYLIYYNLVVCAGAGPATVTGYVAPAFAVLLGVTLLDEQITASAAAGLTLILLGSWLSIAFTPAPLPAGLSSCSARSAQSP